MNADRSLGAPGLSRRRFLALAGSGAALGALARLPASAALAAASAAAQPAPAFFSADESEILTQIVERMVGADGADGAPRVRDTRALAVIDRLCAGLDPSLTQPLPLLLRAVEWGPYVFDWTFARWTTLDGDAKDASLRGWMESSLALRRLAFQALKNLSCLGWYSQDASWSAIGYQGPLLARPGGAA